MEAWLLDMGPIVAFLDAADAAHRVVVRAFERFDGRFVTTDAVIVEAMHLVSRSPAGPGLLIDFLFSSQAAIHSSMSADNLLQAGGLITKYADEPMDFADATLVLLAARLRISAVCSLDRRGFRTYRSGTRKAFDLVLDRGAG
jgi:predicted nucleic acid-binding protein